MGAPAWTTSCTELTEGNSDAFDCSADVGGNGLTAAKGSPEDCSGACTEANCCEAPAQARLRRRAQDFAATCGEETDGGAAYTCTAGTADASAAATECTAGTCDDAQCCTAPFAATCGEETDGGAAYVCTAGTADASATATECPSGGCDDTTCCEEE